MHEQPQSFAQACELDPGLPQLLRESAAHDNNQVSRVAAHIQAERAKESASTTMAATTVQQEAARLQPAQALPDSSPLYAMSCL